MTTLINIDLRFIKYYKYAAIFNFLIDVHFSIKKNNFNIFCYW